ncbi:MAG: phage holin family protein [Candidatus Colwellbacteria bacterium]|nr:phage holin family protein [Candidatus Colwellbacteria bacterium]
MRTLIRWAVLTFVIMVLANWIPNVTVENWKAAVIAALVLGLINTLLKPVITFIAFPINLLTFGLFSVVINAWLVLLASDMVAGFGVEGFWTAVLFSLAFSIASSLISWIL